MSRPKVPVACAGHGGGGGYRGTPLARRAQRRAASGRDPRRRAAADPGRGRYRARRRRCARGSRGWSARASPSERILLLTFTRRASREMLQRARGLVPASSRGARRHLPFGRAPIGPAARRGAGVTGRVRGARRRRCRRRAGPAALRARAREVPDALPEEGHAAGHLLAHGQRAGAAVGGDRGVLPVVLGAPRADLFAVSRVHGPQARAGRVRPRRPAAVLARAGPRRGDRAADRRRRSTTC